MPWPKASSEKISQPEHDEASGEYQRGMNEIRKQLGPMADSYTRDVLDLKTLELCTVAALTVQGFSLPELKLHIDAALRSGASREEVIEVITQMIAYVGFPAATNALMTAQAVFEDRDATKEAKQAAE
jgi:alkylhydroperoxidase/carboxymuconolactone decarboxylase family protein YurZ